MESAGSVQPILRIEPAAYPATDQQQRSPFQLNQLLQGVIGAKTGPHQFTLEVAGQQVQAQSTADLRVGQSLDLRVSSLTPQVVLQIVPQNPLSRLIGNAMHLAKDQASAFADLTHLARESEQLPQMSAAGRDTLNFFATNTVLQPATAATLPPSQWIPRLLGRILFSLPALAIGEQAETYADISRHLNQLAGSPLLSQTLAKEAASLAVLFTRSSELPSGAAAFTVPSLIGEPAQSMARLNTLLADMPQGLALLNQLSPLLDRMQLPADHPFSQLTVFLEKIAQSAPTGADTRNLNGPLLETMINRLGLNMEQLLAMDERQQAMQSLKFALLNLSEHSSNTAQSQSRADHLIKTIELYQLLQIRLGEEALQFLPLPLTFLDQGYLLADRNLSGSDKEGTSARGGRNAQRYELHLKLEGLGNLRIVLEVHEQRLAVQFFTEDAERAGYLADFRSQLTGQLTALELESAQFLVGAADPAAVLLEKIMHGTTGLIDTSI